MTTYMGLELKNPIIAGASTLTADMGTIKQLEDAGTAALVIRSLFEEQIQLQHFKFDEHKSAHEDVSAEIARNVPPHADYAGPAEHLMWVSKAKEAVSIPVIGSLSCVNEETWVEYAKKMADTGIDALELNFYKVPADFEKSGEEVERELIQVLKRVKESVSIPVSVKLSPFYSNPLNFIAALDQQGMDGVVVFNRLFQPDIDIEKEKNTFEWNLSQKNAHQLPLRYAGLLYGHLEADVCASSGIFSGRAVARMLLAGANCVQVVTALFRHDIKHIKTMLSDLTEWMDRKKYTTLDDFIGKMSRLNSNDPWVYKRAQYVHMLLKGNPLD